MIGTAEIVIIAGVAMVLFGGTALPKFARSLGQAKKEFEKGLKDGAKEADKKEEAEPNKA
jgi:sec-independent protein translocase protein TatA